MNSSTGTYIPYGKQSISDKDIKAVSKSLSCDLLTGGEYTKQFESLLSQITRTPSTSVSSGTAAIHCAYKAMGIGNGSVVLTTPITFIATVAPAIQLGANVIFADVDPETGLLCPESVKERISTDTACVAAVDYAGHPVNTTDLKEICRNHGSWLFEDAAHSLGSTVDNRPVGSLSDITTFSFFPTKNITCGEGGAISSNDKDLLQQSILFKDHGLSRSASITKDEPWAVPSYSLGLNYRLTDILSSIALEQLKRLQYFKLKRSQLKKYYDDALRDVSEVAIPFCENNVDPMWHLYPLRVLDGTRAQLWKFLHDNGVKAQVNYIPVYRHPAVSSRISADPDTPNAEMFYSQQISLPMFVDLKQSDVDLVISLIRKFYNY